MVFETHPSWVLSRYAICEADWKEPGDKCQAAVVNVVSAIRRKIWDGILRLLLAAGIGLWVRIRAAGKHLETGVAIGSFILLKVEIICF